MRCGGCRFVGVVGFVGWGGVLGWVHRHDACTWRARGVHVSCTWRARCRARARHVHDMCTTRARTTFNLRARGVHVSCTWRARGVSVVHVPCTCRARVLHVRARGFQKQLTCTAMCATRARHVHARVREKTTRARHVHDTRTAGAGEQTTRARHVHFGLIKFSRNNFNLNLCFISREVERRCRYQHDMKIGFCGRGGVRWGAAKYAARG